MIIAVADTRIYKFPQSTIAVEIHSDYAEVLVLPERQKFILRLQPQTLKAMQATYPGHTNRQLLSTFIIRALEDGFLPVNEEIP